MQMQGSDTSKIANLPERAVVLPVIPGYRVERRLGLGGMATVYLAVQESLDREVAIKVMRPSRQLDEKQSLRFEHEARIIAKLQHPGIMVIHEVGRTQQGDLYYVMPYLARGDLSVRDYRDDEPGLIALLRALLDALGYAHARGIVHRDVKPENVLFDNADRPQLADFGIALSRGEANSRITGDGLAIGSGATMSPEQARADKVDGRSDLYSLGVLTYELLTGELPFTAADSLSLALMHAQDPVPRLPAEKAHWQAFVDCAMAKQPEQRFRNAQAMQRALEPIRRHARRAAGPFGRLRHALSHRPAPLVATGLLLAVSLVSLALPYFRPATQTPADSVKASAAPAGADSIDGQKSLAELNALASQQISIGALLTPAGSNAAETYLVMLQRDPHNPQAIAGLESVIGASIPSLTAAIDADDVEQLRERYLQIELAADSAKIRDNPAFTQLRGALRVALKAHIEALAANGNPKAAMQHMQLTSELGFDDAELKALETRLRNQPAVGQPLRDAGGEEFMLVPERINGTAFGKAFLMMRNEVSRSEYAEFARSSGREASRCRNTLSPLRLFDRRDWKDPGFKQSGRDPVVCVSYADARAYADWLGRRSGKSYRLPSKDEWLHAARSLPAGAAACALGNGRDKRADGPGARLDCDDGFANTAPSGTFSASSIGINDLRGNVAEWTSSCQAGGAGTCERRAVLGTSWQDGPQVSLTTQRMHAAERGYDDVGFRLVRDP
ncbi:MAG: SUMF1/EgtB/PvdO family nonheme iron enzyme [Xanthomonadales bacterium]|nr:SUMF1/EgtB/PvdO family nonheme iron enzyme [Xanthomonadales bacterium]